MQKQQKLNGNFCSGRFSVVVDFLPDSSQNNNLITNTQFPSVAYQSQQISAHGKYCCVNCLIQWKQRGFKTVFLSGLIPN